MALNSLQVGPVVASKGAAVPQTANFDASTRTLDAHARFQDAVLRGNVFSVVDTAGHTSPAGLSTSPINVSLYNPVGSNTLAVIWRADIFAIVAFTAAAAVWLAVLTSATATTGTNLAATNMLTGASNTSVCKGLTTATLAANPTQVMLTGAGLTGAITVETMAKNGGAGWVDGAIVLSPGQTLVVVTSTASGASGLLCGFAWEEMNSINALAG